MENTEKLVDLLMTQQMNEDVARKMVTLGEKDMLEGQENTLVTFIVKSYLEAEDMESFEMDIDYAIVSLKRLQRKI